MVVSVPPLRGIVQALLPEGSVVDTLIPPGVSEHGYEIPPARLAALASADLVVYVGMGLEPQVEKALAQRAVAGRTIVRFADVPQVGSALAPKAGCTDPDHHHGEADKDDHDHHHDHHHGSDPHVWLDPIMVRALAAHLDEQLARRAGLVDASPSSSGAGVPRELSPKARALVERIDAIHARYESIGERARATGRTTIVVAHDAFGWLTQRYGLTSVAIAGLSAGEPKPGDIARASDAVRKEKVTTVFVEPQLSDGPARRIAQAAGAKVDTLDPLGDGDWFALMEANARAIERALLGETSESPVHASQKTTTPGAPKP